MWKTKDKMWKYVMSDVEGGRNGNPFSSDFDPDEIVDKADQLGRMTPELAKMITAVAGKYIEGHLKVNSLSYGIKCHAPGTPKKNVTGRVSYINSLTGEHYKDVHNTIETQSVYDYLHDNGVLIYIETNMPPQGQEGQLRVMSIVDHVDICRAIDDGENVNYCMDTEHLTLNYLNPIDEAKLLARWRDKHKLDTNKYFTMFHINAPRPQMGVHGTIRRLSMDPEIMYNQLWWMREAGIRNSYIIWERGSWGPVEDSAITYRALKDNLIQNVRPENLPPSLFGIDAAFNAMQKMTVNEHGFDMLKDLFMFASPDKTSRGTNALQKQGVDVWMKSRYR